MNQRPIACSLSAAELAAQHETLLPGLVARATEHTRLADGFRWRFAPDPQILADMAAVIEAERHCCQFLEFRITVEADGGPVWLDVTGPEGTVELLAQLMA